MIRGRSGNMVIEAALLIPVLVMLIVGMVQIGKVTYVYFALKKMVWAAGRQISSAPAVNFCDLAGDANVQAAIQAALTDANGVPIIATVTSLQVTAECGDPANPSGALIPCDVSQCPTVGQRPDFFLVTIPNGYQVQLHFLFLDPIPITLNPFATVPYGGLS
jgi:hypothetical protein